LIQFTIKNSNYNNLINDHVIFLRVDLAELKGKLEELKPDVDFLTDAEAQDYHQSLLITQDKIKEDNTVNRKLPEEI